MSVRENQASLHAYVDQELDILSTLRLEEHLATCDECRSFLAEQQQLRSAVRESSLRYAAPPALERKLQSALRREGGRSEAPAKLDGRLMRFASAAAVVLLAAIGLWYGASKLREPSLTNEILSSHVRSLMADHTTDIASSEQHVVKPWFTGKIDFAPVVKDTAAQGYPLLGGRLDYLDGRTVAAIVYGRRRHIINVFVWPLDRRDSAPQCSSTRGFQLCEWNASGLRFSAVSDLNAAELKGLAEILRR
jgi:anti-sigma factor RsiW